jgi:hypothetical protein
VRHYSEEDPYEKSNDINQYKLVGTILLVTNTTIRTERKQRLRLTVVLLYIFTNLKMS